ncbi:MAG: hypothetical protein ACJA2Y_000187 [Cycloclasticus pugetii]|jgi:hypothetical protein|uniref:Lipoprotein n=2 Tax=Cycloclasticus TaxID=34067 RepID=S5T4X3_9GAMM|nr:MULTISPECIES: hypothetical protein [Cycloclasticus]AFT67964.1 hypothetical protein Q91_1930 [Cycloclasticus sp. P1]AGS38851.1 hypothetical protein CYCME_0510 [Cycloclasticus zancles 78-ME]ATI02500.1 hypothetical protein CPC19_03175 [Cycloclasticus sp. PY97N]EPD12963.1 hypothetical protein L196_07364 [Cycloclasticus pugetii]MDF1829234.1 hypothetical protein [Cycloclasticus pugetii]|tara:strand:+ start:580 stop:990 length:411 start_codon:yes stop_codon:yes gene_type:complete
MKNIKWVCVGLILMLSACAHITEQKKLEHLDAKQKLFMKALRWKSYETAASVIRYRNPARKLAPIDGLNKITVTSYDLIGSVPNEEDDTIIAQALFGYIQNETGRVYQVKHTQVWWFDEESKQWFLDSDMPDFRID